MVPEQRTACSRGINFLSIVLGKGLLSTFKMYLRFCFVSCFLFCFSEDALLIVIYRKYAQLFSFKLPEYIICVCVCVCVCVVCGVCVCLFTKLLVLHIYC